MIKTGTKHRICEDAVLSGDVPFSYIIVADGCSSSSETHIGSNILAKSAEFILNKRFNSGEGFEDMGVEIINRAWKVGEQIPIKKNALDSTLIMSWIIGDLLYYIVFGDGVVFYNNKNSNIIKEYTQVDNMPDYLSYFLHKDAKEIYIEKATENKKNISFKSPLFNIDYKDNVFEYELKVISVKYLKNFIISTDGISSFYDRKEYIPINNLPINDFKNLQGDFLERRIKRIIKVNQKNNIYHHDDIGMAGFSFLKGVSDNE
jgi:hypothetical protein